MKRFTLEEILDLNPQIDREALERTGKILKVSMTQESKHHYKLVPPFARPRVTVGEDDKSDSRTIVLRQTKK